MTTPTPPEPPSRLARCIAYAFAGLIAGGAFALLALLILWAVTAVWDALFLG